MSKTYPDFFRRHKKLMLFLAVLVLLAIVLAWYHRPRPLLTGRDLRQAQNELTTPIYIWQYIRGERIDVTDRIDRAALVERLTATHCIRFFSSHDGVFVDDLRYEIDISLPNGAIHLPLGAPEPYLSTNHAYRSARGNRTIWRVLDYEELIADLDAMLAHD